MNPNLINIVNQLQDVFSSGVCSGVDLPQIVVVGSQNAGKSSVLEHIVGKSFLPRGTGIVTRCPLVLQLVNSPNVTEEYAVFQHNRSQIFTNYDLVRKEIEERTIQLAGSNSDICEKPINLKIFSSSLTNLTLVDLPELTSAPVGDQPLNIDTQTRELVLSYIKNPNSIILLVIAANNLNIASCSTFLIARHVDTHSTRTMAVLTQLDLMEEGKDSTSREMLIHGQIKGLKLGTIGVIHWSQTDILNDDSIKRSLKDEAEFLQKNFKTIAVKHGSPYLARTLQVSFMNCIRRCMPDLKKRICNKFIARKSELHEYKKYAADDPNHLLLNLINKFTNHYISSVKGHVLNTQKEADCGLAKINYIFQEVFAKAIWSEVNSISKGSIAAAVSNGWGMHPSISVSEAVFENLAKKQIEKLRNPSLTCVHLVLVELNNIAQSCLEEESLQIRHYPELKSILRAGVSDLIQSFLSITNQSVENFIDIQVAHINTSHPDFLLNPTHPSVEEEEAVNNVTRESVNAVVTKSLESYMSIVCKIVEDTVQKTIMHFMVNSVLDRLLVELVRRVHQRGNVEDLLRESPTIVSRRKELVAEVAALEKAVAIINGLNNVDQKQPVVNEC